ncbi:MAG: hypothetical protein U0667_10965 [Chloroflexota bacterium]
MRIYEGRPRQDYEEVFRSLGGFIDQRGMRGVLILEAPDGFVVQGLALVPDERHPSERVEKETYTFLDEDVARFIEESRLRRGTHLDGVPAVAGPYERALRVLGGYVDQQQPRDVFLMEQEGSWLLRLLMGARTGMQHVLVEFTPDEIAMRADHAPALRTPNAP